MSHPVAPDTIGNITQPAAVRRWLDRKSITVAWMALIIAIIHPPHGTGLPICFLHATTGIPCPGCGMTRSLSCAVRGMYCESWQYHPFGLPFAAVILGVVISSVLPRGAQSNIHAWLQRWSATNSIIYMAMIGSFVVFGVCRALAHLPIH